MPAKRNPVSRMPAAAEDSTSLEFSSSTLPEFDDLERQFQEEMQQIAAEEAAAAKPKKTKAAPMQTMETSSDDMQVSAEDIEDLVCFPLDTWFVRQKKDKLSEDERANWSKAVAKVLNKYSPTFMNKWGPEIGLVVSFGMIMAVRIEIPEVKEIEEKPIAKPAEMAFRNPATTAQQADSIGE